MLESQKKHISGCERQPTLHDTAIEHRLVSCFGAISRKKPAYYLKFWNSIFLLDFPITNRPKSLPHRDPKKT